MTIPLLLVGGIAFLYLGGEALVRGACSLALRLRVSPMVVGLTIVAFGTSAPELVVSLSAAVGGSNDIAVGNVVGSNVANLALILGFAALLRPARVEAKLLRIDAPLMVLVSAVVLLMLRNDALSRAEGMVLLVGFVGYTAFTFAQGRRESPAVQQEFVAVARGRKRRVVLDLVIVMLGSVALVSGARLFVRGAIDLAGILGVSQALVGLTVVAIGTSLPEFAASLIAVRRGQGDIAVGNVIGSNLFNLLGILGVTSVVAPLARGNVDWSSLGVMLGITLLVLPMMYTRRRVSRPEGGILLSVYVAYVVWLMVVVLPGSRAPRFLMGQYEDDYGNRYAISDTQWVQEPRTLYIVESWHPDEGYAIARNGPDNSYDPDLWSRIDWVKLEGMLPWRWAFCLTAFNAPSAAAARATATAVPETPRTGCNGFPYSRMRSIE